MHVRATSYESSPTLLVFTRWRRERLIERAPGPALTLGVARWRHERLIERAPGPALKATDRRLYGRYAPLRDSSALSGAQSGAQTARLPALLPPPLPPPSFPSAGGRSAR